MSLENVLNLRDTGLQLARATVAAARAVVPYSGKDKKHEADHVAVEAMRSTLNECDLKLRVLLGEGEKDKAPMLFSGERLGRNRDAADAPCLDLVVDPLECTTNFARGLPDSLSVLLAAPQDSIQKVPGTYMEQLLVPAAAASLLDGVIDLETPVGRSVHAIAEALGLRPTELTVVVQDRARHKYLIEEIRDAGAGIALIDSGSLSAAFEIIFRPGGRLNVLWGTFGAPEGLLLAFMAKTSGCGFLGRVMPHNSRAEKETHELGLEGRTLRHDEFIRGEGVLLLSGIHSSTWMRGLEILREVDGKPRGDLVRTALLSANGLELCEHRDGQLTDARPFVFPM